MQGGEKLGLEQIRALLEASQEVQFTGHRREEIYDWVEKTLREHDYAKQGREAKGLLRSYVAKMTGQSRAQVMRLIGKYVASGEVRPTVYRRHRFPTRYTRIDTAHLAAQVVACVPQISEAWLEPALYSKLQQFPFKIRGFHSDNGSEFINHNVSQMLKKLLVEQTTREGWFIIGKYGK